MATKTVLLRDPLLVAAIDHRIARTQPRGQRTSREAIVREALYHYLRRDVAAVERDVTARNAS